MTRADILLLLCRCRACRSGRAQAQAQDRPFWAAVAAGVILGAVLRELTTVAFRAAGGGG